MRWKNSYKKRKRPKKPKKVEIVETTAFLKIQEQTICSKEPNEIIAVDMELTFQQLQN
jgi:hypothetical protein